MTVSPFPHHHNHRLSLSDEPTTTNISNRRSNNNNYNNYNNPPSPGSNPKSVQLLKNPHIKHTSVAGLTRFPIKKTIAIHLPHPSFPPSSFFLFFSTAINQLFNNLTVPVCLLLKICSPSFLFDPTRFPPLLFF